MVYHGRFMVNHYHVVLDLLTVSIDHIEQNIAYDRMKYWVYHVLDDAILIHVDDPKLAEYQKLDCRLLVLPDEPVDQNIGIMLYLKLNAIMENRMVVTDIEVSSRQGDNASYLHSVGENLGQYFSKDGWWSDSRPLWTHARIDRTDKIVSLERSPEWIEHELAWGDPSTNKRDAVITAFPKDENK